MFFKKATKVDKIFTVNLMLCSKHQIDGEDFVIFMAFLENMNFNKISLFQAPPYFRDFITQGHPSIPMTNF